MLMSAFVLAGILDWNGWVRHEAASRLLTQFFKMKKWTLKYLNRAIIHYSIYRPIQ